MQNKNDPRISLLMDAVMHNQLWKVARLLKRGVNPNGYEKEDSILYSPLHYAAAHSGLAISILLLEAGADLTAKTTEHETPLDMAHLYENKMFIAFHDKFQQKMRDAS